MFFKKERFKTWKTITLGTGPKTLEDFDKAFKETPGKKCLMSNEAIGMLKSPAFSIASQRIEVQLAKVTVSELGFHCAPRANIYARAQELGLHLCPMEVGPRLRLQYLDQPIGIEWLLLVGMQPVAITAPATAWPNTFTFSLYSKLGELWLQGYWSRPREWLEPKEQLVFLK